jgi:hypothetical protein
MANDTFATFSEVSGLQFNDYLVGYRNITETRIGYAGLVNTFVAAVSTDNEKINNTYLLVNSSSANWNSTYSTVQTYSASWEESSEIIPTVTNFLSTNNVLLSGLLTTSISSSEITTNQLSSRQISLINFPENDGINPNFFVGETGTGGISGFNIFYDEISNRLVLTSQFTTQQLTALEIDQAGTIFAKKIDQQSFLNINFSTLGTSYTTVSSLSFNALANRFYEIDAFLPHSHSTASTNSYGYALSFSSGTAKYIVEIQTAPNSSAFVNYATTTDGSFGTGVTTASTSERLATIRGTFFHTSNVPVCVRAKTSGGTLVTLASAYISYRIIN